MYSNTVKRYRYNLEKRWLWKKTKKMYKLFDQEKAFLIKYTIQHHVSEDATHK